MKKRAVKQRSGNLPTVHSIGYEGKDINTFVSTLKENCIERLIDVREVPFSFKKGFSKTPLMKALEGSNIEYFHFKELGTDKPSRDEYKRTGDMGHLLETYRKRFMEHRGSYNELVELARSRRSTIMCFEDDHLACHRQVIEEELEEDGFRLVNLCHGKDGRSLLR